jgi:putative copper resistance protein D
MSLDAILEAARFTHYAALTSLFGVALFPFYAGRPERDLRPILVAAAIAVSLTGLFWLAASAAAMTGELSGALDPATLWTVTSEMDFGRVWAVRLLLSLVAIAAAAALRPGATVAILAGALVASVALTGHAREETGLVGLLHTAADAAHLLAAGAWLGGLIPLALTARRSAPADLAPVLRRFSGMGSLAVAVLIATGLVNAWLLVGTPEALVATPYGRLLGVKLILVALMLLLASANRWWLTPRIASAGAAQDVLHLRGHILAEQVLGLAVLAIVGVLGATAPSVTLPN